MKKNSFRILGQLGPNFIGIKVQFFCKKRLNDKSAPKKNLKRCFIRVPYMAMEIFKEFFEEKIIEIKMSRDSFETVGN